jgi:hypothetical protein
MSDQPPASVAAESPAMCLAQEWQRDGRGLWAMCACQYYQGHGKSHSFGQWKYNVAPLWEALLGRLPVAHEKTVKALRRMMHDHAKEMSSDEFWTLSDAAFALEAGVSIPVQQVNGHDADCQSQINGAYPHCTCATRLEAGVSLPVEPPIIAFVRSIAEMETCEDAPNRCGLDSGPYCMAHAVLCIDDEIMEARRLLAAPVDPQEPKP